MCRHDGGGVRPAERSVRVRAGRRLADRRVGLRGVHRTAPDPDAQVEQLPPAGALTEREPARAQRRRPAGAAAPACAALPERISVTTSYDLVLSALSALNSLNEVLSFLLRLLYIYIYIYVAHSKSNRIR